MAMPALMIPISSRIRKTARDAWPRMARAVPNSQAANGIVSSVCHMPTTTARYSTPKTSSILCPAGGRCRLVLVDQVWRRGRHDDGADGSDHNERDAGEGAEIDQPRAGIAVSEVENHQCHADVPDYVDDASPLDQAGAARTGFEQHNRRHAEARGEAGCCGIEHERRPFQDDGKACKHNRGAGGDGAEGCLVLPVVICARCGRKRGEGLPIVRDVRCNGGDHGDDSPGPRWRAEECLPHDFWEVGTPTGHR
jgi:hypothetical protein